MERSTLEGRRLAPLTTPSGLSDEARTSIGGALKALLADMLALYLKTKNFHWHVSGPNFRDFHLMLDEQAAQILATTDPIAERGRKIGSTAIRSIGQIGQLQRVLDNDADFVDAQDMLAELRDDNADMAGRMRQVRALCDEFGDVATAGALETWIDEAEGRVWFLFETGRRSKA